MKNNLLFIVTALSFNFCPAAQPAAAELPLPAQLKATRNALLKISIEARKERNKVWREEFDGAVKNKDYNNLPKGDTTLEDTSRQNGNPHEIDELKMKISHIEFQMKANGLSVPRLSTPDPSIDKEWFEKYEKLTDE